MVRPHSGQSAIPEIASYFWARGQKNHCGCQAKHNDKDGFIGVAFRGKQLDAANDGQARQYADQHMT